MDNFPVRRAALPLFCLALLSLLFASCGRKKSETAATPSPTATASAPGRIVAGPTPAPPISGPVTPAVVTEDADSITHYLHFPSDPAAAKKSSVVQFYCDITEAGIVEATYGLVGKDEAFKAAVQSALDWGHFQPATVNGNPVPVYLGGTVIFAHDKGAPVIVVSLATAERDRMSKLGNYIQPQLVGGLRRQVAKIIRQLPHEAPVTGLAEAVVHVDARGVVTSSTVVAEDPKGSGLGDLLDFAIKGAQYTHAYDNGKAVPGAINVAADFSKL